MSNNQPPAPGPQQPHGAPGQQPHWQAAQGHPAPGQPMYAPQAQGQPGYGQIPPGQQWQMPPQKPERPLYKKKRFIIPAAFLALAMIGGAMGDEEPVETETVAASDEAVDAEVAVDDAAAEEQAAADEAAAEEAAAKEAAAAKKKEAAAKKAAAKKEAASAVAVDAAAIIKEFEANELAADTKYDGKLLKVSGTVAKIDTDLFDSDKYILQLNGGGEFEFLSVNCHDMSKKQLSTLQTGQDITVLGTFDDGGDLGVEVKDCKLT